MSPGKKAAQFPCPGCSAEMVYDPESGGMKCPFCGQTQALPANAAIPIAPHPYDEFLSKNDTSALKPLTAQALEVNCDGCGSVVAFQPPETAGMCPFCGAAMVAQPKAADPLIAPDGVLPAKVTKANAQGEVRQWLQTRWFAPNALKKMAKQEGIGGVYLPFWDYDAGTTSRYSGQRGEHYWETETYTDSEGRQQTRQVMYTRWYPASGEVSRQFDDVLVPASRSVSEAKLCALEPWDLEALCVYEPAYLAGFKAQRYQLELPEAFEHAKNVMQETIQGDVRKDIGGDEQRIDGIETTYANVMFRHLLLPVWIGAYRFQNKVYQVAVNARTGEVQGERPYSGAKITLLVIAILIVIAILYLLGSNR